MNYIISGATGCIGYALVSKLLKEKQSITLILNPISNRNKIFDKFKDLKIHFEDLSNYKNIKLNSKYNVFIHLAWSGGSQRNNYEINNASCFYSLDAFDLALRCGCSTFLSIGSQAEYGITSKLINEKHFCIPQNEFGIAKLNTFFRLKKKAINHNINFSWLRVLSAYGPYDRSSSMLMNTIKKIISGELPRLSDGNQYWDFIHADDIADVLIKLSKTKIKSNLYVIGSDERLQLKEYINILCKELNFDSKKILGKLKLKKNEIVSLKSDSSLIRNHTQWFPKIDINYGFSELVKFVKSHN